MMITILGLSPKTKYQDVKMLIKQECNIDDFILDNLVVDTNGTKKVRIGLPDENEGYKVMKCLNGYHMAGNFLLKVVPVGKTTVNPNGFPPGGYDSRPDYQNQPRNDYSQPSSNDYNRGALGPNASRVSGIPQGPGGPHGPSGPRGPIGPNKAYGPGGPQGPMDNSRPSPWSLNSNNPNQWSQNQPMAAQVPQNTFQYAGVPQSNVQPNFPQGPGPSQHLRPEVRPYEQGRPGPPTEQFGGYPLKNNAPPARQADLRHNLRSIDTSSSSNQAPGSMHTHGGRYPPQQFQDKPMTIMKDNFQGPTQFNINHPGGNQPYQQQEPSSWQQGHPHQTQPPKPQFSKSTPTYEKSFDDRKYPQGDLSRDPKNLQSKPDTYKEYEKRRGFSTPDRDAIPRRSSPGRREDPLIRDPSGRLGDMGPRRPSPGRMDSQRRPSPGRMDSQRRPSPGRMDTHRRPSPGRMDSQRRPSPGRMDTQRRPSPGRMDTQRRPSPGRMDTQRRPSPGRMDSQRRPSPGRLETQRRPSPGRLDTQRRVSPQGRREDPHGRRYSPSGKRHSPGERRNAPVHSGMRHTSPHKRPSPSRRLVSPARRDDRPIPRFSPTRHHSDKPSDRFAQDKDLKKVRPAYEPTSSHAPNQAMYSGGYRPGHDNAQYPGPGMRQDQPSPWQRHRDEPAAPMKKQEEERRDTRMPMVRERAPENEKHFSPMHKSRSPIRDRFKRNSPSPRSSYSPRRSWALEKRSSPDAPPPPVWPGQNTDRDHARPSRPNFPDKDEKPKRPPVWEGRIEDDARNRRPEERRPFDDPKIRRPDDRRQFEEAKIRVAKNLMERETAQAPMGDRYQPKFSPRNDFEERRDNYRRRDTPDRKPHRDDFDLSRRPRDDDRPPEYSHRRDSPRRERREEATKAFDKDFEDIYNRALQFKKKTEELRKSSSKKRDDFDGDRRHNEKDREEMRQRYEDRARYREDEAMRQREREREDRLRDERSRDDRPRHDDERRGDYHPRNTQQSERERENTSKPSFGNSNAIQLKKDKAVEEISRKMIERSEEFKHVHGEQKSLIMEELKMVVSKIIYDMFGDSDVSFIEIIIKYQAKYNLKEEEKILQDVMRLLPKQMRVVKRHAGDASDIPAKVSRFSPVADLKTGTVSRPKLSDSNFNVNLAPPSVISVPFTGAAAPQQIMGPPMVPMMVSAPFYQSFDSLQQNFQNPMFAPKPVQPVMEFADMNFSQPVVGLQPVPPPSFPEEEKKEDHTLYLCKDDFDKISSHEAELLKEFLINSMFQATAQYQGWSPDFTLKGLQSLFRYELVTKDEWSRNWLMKLDFSEFPSFNVLVYTKEELWYERAAIWLPGHSKVRNIEPLEKLKLQNKKLEGVNIDKWKFVKKIVTDKGTRLYVDMPPSSARALEANEMKLSYELQQVNIFLKAVAVDKDSFDAGLKEHSITNPAEIAEATLNSPMPSLTQDNSLVKIILKGSKTLDLVQARKIKEVVIYNLFRYHQEDGLSRTDFVKYGFLQPNYFAILPLNQESKRWLTGCSFGKVNKQAVVVIGGEEDNTRFFKMSVTVPFETQLKAAHVTERLKHSNQGVKGINFNKWKNAKVKAISRKKLRYDVEIDLESLETLATMRYQLDYGDLSGMHAVYVRSEYSQSGLEEAIKKYKAEMTDTYDVANMDLESDQSDSVSNDGVICLD